MRMKHTTLNTDRIFQSLSIPATAEQTRELERSLIRDGCLEPIIVWHGIILDGHKRYQICRDEGIEFTTEEKEFRSQEEAILWICRKRISSCGDKTPAYRYLVGRLYAAQKQIFHDERMLPESNKTVKLEPKCHRVSYLLTKELRIHSTTVENYGTYALAMDKIADKSWSIFQALLAGEITLSLRQTSRCAAMNEKQIKAFLGDTWHTKGDDDGMEKLRRRSGRRKKDKDAAKTELPLAVGIKKMPAYDPDMELKGLSFTIPSWILSLERVEKKTDTATEDGKDQLRRSLQQLQSQIEKLLGVMEK